MPVTASLATELDRLTPREKAALADHLWREAESKLGPTPAQLRTLAAREKAGLSAPHKLKPLGDALQKLKR